MGILNVLGHFAAPALAPVFLNIAMIASMFAASFITEDSGSRVAILSVGVIAGGILQLGFQFPFLIKYGFYFWKKAPFFHKGLKQVGRLMIPALIGAAVYQVNIVAGTIIASFLSEGSISALYYADRIVQFPLGVFAISIGTAVMPGFSRCSANMDYDGLRETFSYGIRLMLFIMVPAAIGLIVLREPIVALLFKRGSFTAEDVRITSDALLYYSLGIVAVSCVRIIAPVFYSMKDTATPVKIAVVSIVSNIILSLILIKPLGHCGLALATSLASLINCLLLLILLQFRLGNVGWFKIVFSLFKTLVISLTMGIFVHKLALYIIPSYNTSIIALLTGVVASIAVGACLFVAGSVIIKSSEFNSTKKMIFKK
jgi:putative peptidoglycan lipid II flippase